MSKLIIPEQGEKLTPSQELYNRLMQRLLDSGSHTIRFETSSCAPAHGWCETEYAIMPYVAEILRKNDCIVSSAVNHFVTDWTIVKNF
jgi:hypothetical protein